MKRTNKTHSEVKDFLRELTALTLKHGLRVQVKLDGSNPTFLEDEKGLMVARSLFFHDKKGMYEVLESDAQEDDIEGDMTFNTEYINDRPFNSPNIARKMRVLFSEISSGVYKIEESVFPKYELGSYVSSETVLSALNNDKLEVTIARPRYTRYINNGKNLN